MNPVIPSALTLEPEHFTDGLGVRLRVAEHGGEELEVLRLAREFVAVPAFEFALRERVGRLANFRHTYFARVRRVDRFDNGTSLGVVSEHVHGARLSHVLAVAEQQKLTLDINAALCLIRQLVPAIALLHENAREVTHGALAPERILVSSQARIVVTDYVLGSALDQLRLSRERLWRDLRIAVPAGAGSPRLDHRADVMQLGAVSLALILGRQLRRDELRAIPELVASATETTVVGERTPLSAPLRRWLLRMLQADPRGSYQSATDAQQGLDEVLNGEGGYVAAPVALEAFLGRYEECAILALPEELPQEPQLTPAATRPQPVAPAPAIAAGGPEPEAPLPVRPAAHGSVLNIGQLAPARRPPEPEPVPRFEPLPPALAFDSTARPFGESLVQPLADSPQPSRSLSGRFVIPKTLHDQPPPVDDVPEAQAEDVPDADPVLVETGRRARYRRWRRLEHTVLVIAVALAVGEAGFIRFAVLRDGSIAGNGTLVVESRPSGVAVVVDGDTRGTTPLTLALKQGAHVLELRAGDDTRVVPVTIRAGATYAQYVELPTAQVRGTLDVRDLPGARVLVDGELRGTSPVRVGDLSPGTHDVLLDGRGVRVRRRVIVEAGQVAVLGRPDPAAAAVTVSDAEAPGPAAAAGWVSLEAPYEMKVLEDGTALGTTSQPRLSLPAGHHELEVVSETLGFHAVVPVDVRPGAGASATVRLPQGVLMLEAEPGADVLVDGAKVGTTPMSPIRVAVGPHEVSFVHPELGRQEQAVSVRADRPARVAVSLVQK